MRFVLLNLFCRGRNAVKVILAFEAVTNDLVRMVSGSASSIRVRSQTQLLVNEYNSKAQSNESFLLDLETGHKLKLVYQEYISEAFLVGDRVLVGISDVRSTPIVFRFLDAVK